MRSGNKLSQATAKLLVALFLLSCVSRARTPRHHDLKARPQNINSQLGWPVYELDSDWKSDQVTLQSNGYDKKIHIKFGNLRREELSFTTNIEDNGKLVAGDIDRDGDLDLIWVGSADRKNAIVLINQGEGDFAEASDNTPFFAELDGLFNTGDSPQKRLRKGHRRASSLTSPPFSDISLTFETRSYAPAIQTVLIASVDSVAYRRAVLTCINKRGPPPILS